MESLLILALPSLLFCTVTPLPEMLGFQLAWAREHKSTALAILLAVPTTVFPVVLLILHGQSSTPEWKELGTYWIACVGVGPSAWICLPPFVGANYVIARVIGDREFLSGKLFLHLSLVTYLMICAFFAIGNLHRGGMAAFPGSAGVAYAYALFTLPPSRRLEQPVTVPILLLTAWLITGLLTVLAIILRTRQMVEDLPDEAPGCFVVTAASQGHPWLVGRHVPETRRLTNRQLMTFRAFECWLQQSAPVMHGRARRSYNHVGPVIAGVIVRRWQADAMYLALKPLEWVLRLTPVCRKQ